MVIYPGIVLTGNEGPVWNVADGPTRVTDILRNQLNDKVVYERSEEFVFFDVYLRQSAPWQHPIMRKYVAESPAWDWAVSHWNSENHYPNAVCPICNHFFYIEYYNGRNVLSLSCQRCMSDWIGIGDEPHEYQKMVSHEKVDWMRDGF